MAVLDADLVHRWFDRLRRQDLPLSFGGMTPSGQEFAALDEGGAAIDAALRDLAPPAPVLDLTETSALMLRDYLAGLAAGISEARRLLSVESPAIDLMGGLDPGASAGGALALAAGLNAAAAALHGPNRSPLSGSLSGSLSGGVSAAESARTAGVTAAELVVDGADLHRVAAMAAGSAINGWRIGQPDDPAERADYRTKVLVGMTLIALQQECRDPLPPAQPAGCGALPGQNLGAAFRAEITCTMRVDGEAMAMLSGELGRLCDEVAIWPTHGDPAFHLHTDRPGAVIELLYASGMPFDLQISQLPGSVPPRAPDGPDTAG